MYRSRWRLSFLVLLLSNGVTSGAAGSNEPAAITSDGDTSAGRHLFEQHCAVCHGMNGSGARGPNLRKPVLQHASNIPQIASVIQQGIDPEMPPGWYLSSVDLANLAAYVYMLGKTPQDPVVGNPTHGEAVFERTGCPSCHVLRGRGNAYGPDLSNIGATRGPTSIRQKIVDPTATLTPTFLLVEATTASGETIRGIRRNEDTLSIQVQDATGRFRSFQKAQLRALKRLPGETPMPSFSRLLSTSDLDDLVSFLARQKYGS